MSKFSDKLTKSVDVLIIGAGPAGLSCAQQLKVSHDSFLVVDMGKNINERQRYNKKDVVSGVGGAGFYSDGKFSFFPSATYLWKIKDQDFLKSSYNWTKDILAKHGVNAPNFPSKEEIKSLTEMTKDRWVFKPYPSLFMEIDERIKFVESLFDEIKDNTMLETKVESIEYDRKAKTFKVKARQITLQKDVTISAKKIVAAGGRFFPHFITKFIPKESQQYLRTEIGFRLESDASHPFFDDLTKSGDVNDPKHVFFKASDHIEWRTFCCCKQGETVESLMGEISSFSGRSDCPPTGRSNIAFNTRLLSPELMKKCKILNSDTKIGNKGKIFKIPMLKLLKEQNILDDYFGAEVAKYVVEGLQKLTSKFPSLLREDYNPMLVGPTVEGVGFYPKFDYKDLKIPEMPIYFAGDNCGKFRGIVAAMISGAYVGKLLNQQ